MDASREACPGAGEPRWKVYACLALLLAALAVVVVPKIRLRHWHIEPHGNAALAEALQWRRGSMALAYRLQESARVGDRYYNFTGPAFTLISVVATTLADAAAFVSRQLGRPGNFAAFPAALYVALIAVPLPFIAFWAFRRVMKDSVWAAVLTFYLIAGTSLTFVLATCQSGSVYFINHVLAVFGQLIFAADLLGRRRMWPAVVGLCLAAWSRQMTSLYALPLLWIAWRAGRSRPAEEDRTVLRGAQEAEPIISPTAEPPRCSSANRQGIGAMGCGAGRTARRPLTIALLGVAVIAGVPLLLNALKFGDIFETGYSRIYEGRTDAIARRAHQALFSVRFIPMHAWAMNVAYPSWDARKSRLYLDTFDVNGGSIWLTSPILFGVFATMRQWWRDPTRRALMLGTLPVILGLMCYHTTGAGGTGCYRYSLDFLPIWLLVIAPYLLTHRGQLFTVACLIYSTVYFYHVPY